LYLRADSSAPGVLPPRLIIVISNI
jgi:hypothetical protein